MNPKETLQAQILDLDIEMNAIPQQVRSLTVKPEDAEKKIAELRAKKEEAKKALAAMNAPTENRSDSKISREALLKAAEEKRSITIGGTGAINQVKELLHGLKDKKKFLKDAKFFYGANASTVIPVLDPSIAEPADVAEGASGASDDESAVLGTKEIQPKAYISVLPITAEALTMGTVDIESELHGMFEEAFSTTMNKGVVTGVGTDKKMKGIFVAVPAANKTECAATGYPTIIELATLALKVADKEDAGFKLIMNSAVYTGILADTSTDETTKIYKEGLIRDKRIEGIPIELSGVCPSAVTTGSVMVVAAPLARYAIGVAGEIIIDPIKVKGDTKTYFQATMFFSGLPMNDKDLFALKAK